MERSASRKIFHHNFQSLEVSDPQFRIIAKSDGILLFGEDLLRDEKLPKAGMFLALLLNDDILETLDNAEKWMEVTPAATPIQISIRSRRVAKRLIDFLYGVVMTNRPQFTASRKERVERIIEMYPENRVALETLMGISRLGVGDIDSFKNLLDGFKQKVEENLKKMQEVKDHLDKQSGDEKKRP